MLDTNTASYIVKGQSERARSVFRDKLASATVLLSSISEAEMLFGLAKNPKATRLKDMLLALIAQMEVRPWDSVVSRIYATLRAEMSSRGKALTGFDMLIAAHALATGAILVTHDRAFANAGTQLQLEDWATDLQ